MRSTDHPAKRVKTSADASSAAVPDALSSLSRAVSPPPLGHVYQTPAPPNTDPSRKYLKTPAKGSHKSVAINISESDSDGDSKEGSIEVTDEEDLEELVEDEHKHDSYTRSPFTLTRIRDLPDELNKDTIGIEDILGDVMLREVWIFNFCINVAWTMSLLDPDIRDSVTVKFVYGRARKEVTDEMARMVSPFPNVQAIAAYMPETYGTHHSKFFVLFRRDDTARIIIHTANMIRGDWVNMCQAAWISPWLPLLPPRATFPAHTNIGNKFKTDFLAYLSFYENRTASLVAQLKLYSFGAIKAVFIGSVPGRYPTIPANWGWLGLAKQLRRIPVTDSTDPHINIQISSIASLGQHDTWMTPVLFKALASSAPGTGEDSPNDDNREPSFNIIFPTVAEIRDSLNGYRSGNSIHAKTITASHQRQQAYMRPHMCHWDTASSSMGFGRPRNAAALDTAGRGTAAPHIKTYMRLANEDQIDWAIVTSANLSSQAWGAALRQGTVRICSYEAGVLVHPGLWGKNAVMRPVYKQDTMPDAGKELGGDNSNGGAGAGSGNTSEKKEEGEGQIVVPLRMPYNLPVKRYGSGDEVWDQNKSYYLPDTNGKRWVLED